MVKENEEKTKNMNRGRGGLHNNRKQRDEEEKGKRERKHISAQEETVESFNCHPPVSIYPLNWRSSFLARTHEYKVRQVCGAYT